MQANGYPRTKQQQQAVDKRDNRKKGVNLF